MLLIIHFISNLDNIIACFQEQRTTQTLLQSIQEPLPQNSVLTSSQVHAQGGVNVVLGGGGGTVAYSSQLSLETAEADAQVWVVSGFFNSLVCGSVGCGYFKA